MAFNITAIMNVALASGAATKISNDLNKQLGNKKVNIDLNMANADSIKRIKADIEGAITSVESFGRQAGLAAKRFGAFSLAAGSMISLSSAIKRGTEEAIDFDRQMVKLVQVSNDSVSSIQGVVNEVTKLSTSLGVSSKDLIQAAVTLKQANLSIEDTRIALGALAKAALAPNFENFKNTTEGAIAILNQFKIGANNLESALGSVNAVAGEFAVEAGDIVEAIRKTGGAFRAAGGDLNELLGLFTSVRQTTRESAETISTGLRTIFTRIQRGNTVNALKEVGVQLRYTREEALALGNANLEQQFVGPYEAIRRLSVALSTLSSTDPKFAKIVEELGGYRQISKVIPLIQEFAVSQKAVNVAIAGSTSLSQNAGQAQLAYAVKLQKLKEEFNALIRSITQSTGFQKLFDTFISGASAAIQLADALKPLIPLISAFAAVKVATGIGQFVKGFSTGITASPNPKIFNQNRFADGGIVKMKRGGVVPGTGSGDIVPALLEPGEVVIPKKFAQAGPVRIDGLKKRSGALQIENYQLGNKIGYIEDDDKLKANIYKKSIQLTENDFKRIANSYNDPASGKDWKNLDLSKEAYKKAFSQSFKNKKLSPAKILKTELGDAERLWGYEYENILVEKIKSINNQEKWMKIAGDFEGDSLPLDLKRTYGSGLAEAKFKIKKTPDVDLISKLLRYKILKNDRNLLNGFNENIQQKQDDIDLGNLTYFDSVTTKKDFYEWVRNPINKKASGGFIVPGVGNSDSVPIDLEEGSFVIRKSSVSKIGADNLSNMARKRFASGGRVPSLLTPGEFVFSPSSASSIGSSNLDRMNKFGKFALGGRVGFAAGGDIDPRLLITAQQQSQIFKNTKFDLSTLVSAQKGSEEDQYNAAIKVLTDIVYEQIRAKRVDISASQAMSAAQGIATSTIRKYEKINEKILTTTSAVATARTSSTYANPSLDPAVVTAEKRLEKLKSQRATLASTLEARALPTGEQAYRFLPAEQAPLNVGAGRKGSESLASILSTRTEERLAKIAPTKEAQQVLGTYTQQRLLTEEENKFKQQAILAIADQLKLLTGIRDKEILIEAATQKYAIAVQQNANFVEKQGRVFGLASLEKDLNDAGKNIIDSAKGVSADLKIGKGFGGRLRTAFNGLFDSLRDLQDEIKNNGLISGLKNTKLGNIIGAGVLVSSSYIGQASTDVAGTAEAAATGKQSATRYTAFSALGAAISDAGTAAATASISMNPLIIGIAAVGGAILGFVKQVFNARAEIEKIRIDKAVDRLNQSLGDLVGNKEFLPTRGVESSQLKDFLNSYKQERAAIITAAGAIDPEQLRNEIKGKFSGGIQNITQVIQDRLRNIVSGQKIDAAELLQTFRISPVNSDLINLLGDASGKAGDELNKLVFNLVKSVSDEQKLEQVRQNAIAAADRFSVSLEFLSNSVESAVSKFDVASSKMISVIDVLNRSAEFRSPDIKSRVKFGSDERTFSTAIRQVLSPFGQQANPQIAQADVLNKFVLELPSVLASLKAQGGLEGIDNTAQLEKLLAGRGINTAEGFGRDLLQVVADYLEKNQASLTKKGAAFDPAKAAKEALQAQIQDFQNTVNATSDAITRVGQSYVNGLIKIEQEHQRYLSELEKVSEATANVAKLEAELQSSRTGLPVSNFLNPQDIIRPFVERQRNFGVAAGGETNAQQIFNEMKKAQEEVAATSKNLDESFINLASGSKDQREKARALIEANQNAKNRVANLADALKNLRDETIRSAEAQSRLTEAEQQREAKLSAARSMFTMDKRQLKELDRGRAIAQDVAAGADISGLSLKRRKEFVQFTETFKNVRLPEFGGKTGEQIQNLALKRAYPQLNIQSEEDKVNQARQDLLNIAKEQKIAAELYAQFIQEGKTNTEKLKEIADTFIKDLERIFTQEIQRRQKVEEINKESKLQNLLKTQAAKDTLTSTNLAGGKTFADILKGSTAEEEKNRIQSARGVLEKSGTLKEDIKLIQDSKYAKQLTDLMKKGNFGANLQGLPPELLAAFNRIKAIGEGGGLGAENVRNQLVTSLLQDSNLDIGRLASATTALSETSVRFPISQDILSKEIQSLGIELSKIRIALYGTIGANASNIATAFGINQQSLFGAIKPLTEGASTVGSLFGLPKFGYGGEVGGTGNRDNQLAWLTPGEYVVPKTAYQKNGGLIKYLAGGGEIENMFYRGEIFDKSYLTDPIKKQALEQFLFKQAKSFIPRGSGLKSLVLEDFPKVNTGGAVFRSNQTIAFDFNRFTKKYEPNEIFTSLKHEIFHSKDYDPVKKQFKTKNIFSKNKELKEFQRSYAKQILNELRSGETESFITENILKRHGRRIGINTVPKKNTPEMAELIKNLTKEQKDKLYASYLSSPQEIGARAFSGEDYKIPERIKKLIFKEVGIGHTEQDILTRRASFNKAVRNLKIQELISNSKSSGYFPTFRKLLSPAKNFLNKPISIPAGIKQFFSDSTPLGIKQFLSNEKGLASLGLVTPKDFSGLGSSTIKFLETLRSKGINGLGRLTSGTTGIASNVFNYGFEKLATQLPKLNNLFLPNQESFKGSRDLASGKFISTEEAMKRFENSRKGLDFKPFKTSYGNIIDKNYKFDRFEVIKNRTLNVLKNPAILTTGLLSGISATKEFGSGRKGFGEAISGEATGLLSIPAFAAIQGFSQKLGISSKLFSGIGTAMAAPVAASEALTGKGGKELAGAFSQDAFKSNTQMETYKNLSSKAASGDQQAKQQMEFLQKYGAASVQMAGKFGGALPGIADLFGIDTREGFGYYKFFDYKQPFKNKETGKPGEFGTGWLAKPILENMRQGVLASSTATTTKGVVTDKIIQEVLGTGAASAGLFAAGALTGPVGLALAGTAIARIVLTSWLTAKSQAELNQLMKEKRAALLDLQQKLPNRITNKISEKDFDQIPNDKWSTLADLDFLYETGALGADANELEILDRKKQFSFPAAREYRRLQRSIQLMKEKQGDEAKFNYTDMQDALGRADQLFSYISMQASNKESMTDAILRASEKLFGPRGDTLAPNKYDKKAGAEIDPEKIKAAGQDFNIIGKLKDNFNSERQKNLHYLSANSQEKSFRQIFQNVTGIDPRTDIDYTNIAKFTYADTLFSELPEGLFPYGSFNKKQYFEYFKRTGLQDKLNDLNERASKGDQKAKQQMDELIAKEGYNVYPGATTAQTDQIIDDIFNSGFYQNFFEIQESEGAYSLKKKLFYPEGTYEKVQEIERIKSEKKAAEDLKKEIEIQKKTIRDLIRKREDILDETPAFKTAIDNRNRLDKEAESTTEWKNYVKAKKTAEGVKLEDLSKLYNLATKTKEYKDYLNASKDLNNMYEKDEILSQYKKSFYTYSFDDKKVPNDEYQKLLKLEYKSSGGMIPTMLTPGEAVIPPQIAKNNLPLLNDINYRKGGGGIGIVKSSGKSHPLSRGTDTEFQYLEAGSYVVNRASTEKNMGLLKSLSTGGVVYREEGGEVERKNKFYEKMRRQKKYEELSGSLVEGGNVYQDKFAYMQERKDLLERTQNRATQKFSKEEEEFLKSEDAANAATLKYLGLMSAGTNLAIGGGTKFLANISSHGTKSAFGHLGKEFLGEAAIEVGTGLTTKSAGLLEQNLIHRAEGGDVTAGFSFNPLESGLNIAGLTAVVANKIKEKKDRALNTSIKKAGFTVKLKRIKSEQFNTEFDILKDYIDAIQANNFKDELAIEFFDTVKKEKDRRSQFRPQLIDREVDILNLLNESGLYRNENGKLNLEAQGLDSSRFTPEQALRRVEKARDIQRLVNAEKRYTGIVSGLVSLDRFGKRNKGDSFKEAEKYFDLAEIKTFADEKNKPAALKDRKDIDPSYFKDIVGIKGNVVIPEKIKASIINYMKNRKIKGFYGSDDFQRVTGFDDTVFNKIGNETIFLRRSDVDSIQEAAGRENKNRLNIIGDITDKQISGTVMRGRFGSEFMPDLTPEQIRAALPDSDIAFQAEQQALAQNRPFDQRFLLKPLNLAEEEKKPKGFAFGGYVNGASYGDMIPARLRAGEFVLNPQAAQSIGYGNLNAINEQRFFDGGIAGGDRLFDKVTKSSSAQKLDQIDTKSFSDSVKMFDGGVNKFDSSIKSMGESITKLQSAVRDLAKINIPEEINGNITVENNANIKIDSPNFAGEVNTVVSNTMSKIVKALESTTGGAISQADIFRDIGTA